MNASIRRYRIVAVSVLADYAPIVIGHAFDQAARHQLPELHFIHVDEKGKRPIDQLNEYLSAAVYPALQTFNTHGTDWRARLHVRRGKVDQQIATLAADVLADLIVVGQFAHKKGIATRILTEAPCATLVVGMPHEQDMSVCHVCEAYREDTGGDRWFCDEHIVKHVAVTPMSSWTGGQGSYIG